MEKISYAKTVYGQKEIDAVVNCLKSSTQMGLNARKFEKEIAKIFEKEDCLFVNSGSSALYLGIEAYEFTPRSEVITPVLTFSTTVGCLVKNNLIPVFADVLNTYCIDENQIESLITDKTVAILVPNLLGNLPNWIKIREIANKYNLIVIEDSADTLGAKINGNLSGSYSDMSITSFYGSHIINCAGNGGALCLNDKNVLKKAKLLRSWGRSSSLFGEASESVENRFNVSLDGMDYDAKFVFEEVGYNVEGSEIGAAFGLAQLENLQNNIKIRQNNLIKQLQFFEQYPEFFDIPTFNKNVETAFLAFPIMINSNAPFTRKEFQIFLEKRNIQTRVVFTGNILRQPMSKKFKYRTNNFGYPIADRIMQYGVLLPCHHGMTDNMFRILFKTIDDFIAIKNN